MTDNTSEPEEVELVATAMFEDARNRQDRPYSSWEQSPDYTRNAWLNAARAALKALSRPPGQSDRERALVEANDGVIMAAWELCDDTEGTPFTDEDGLVYLRVPKDNWDRVSDALDRRDAALDALDAAPDPSSQGGEDRGSVGSKILPVASPADREPAEARKSGWNYRVMRQDHAPAGQRPDVLYQIHEVHYQRGGKISGWTESPAKLVAETRDEILEVLAMMADALGQPVLCAETGEVIAPAMQLSDELRQALRAADDFFERDDGAFIRTPEDGSQTPPTSDGEGNVGAAEVIPTAPKTSTQPHQGKEEL